MLENIFYTREALGKNGKQIRVHKIRTMVLDADSLWEDIASQNGIDELGKPVNDPRITRAGRILRRYGIDEAPQLYNVLVTRSMSLVGIRPRDERSWSSYPGRHKERALRYRPGFMGTNYATQARDFQEMIEEESSYLDKKEKHPFLTDVEYFLKIIHNIIFRGMRSR